MVFVVVDVFGWSGCGRGGGGGVVVVMAANVVIILAATVVVLVVGFPDVGATVAGVVVVFIVVVAVGVVVFFFRMWRWCRRRYQRKPQADMNRYNILQRRKWFLAFYTLESRGQNSASLRVHHVFSDQPSTFNNLRKKIEGELHPTLPMQHCRCCWGCV